jgi:flagellar assembly protein FliH
LSETSQVLDARIYAVGDQPYLVQQLSTAALAELRRKREAANAAPAEAVPAASEPKTDPVAEQLRAEAAQIKAQAERLLRAAEERAKAMAAEAEAAAQQTAAKAKEEGYQEGFSRGSEDGYEEGQAKGEEAGLQKYTETLTRLQSLLESAQAEKDAYFADREAIMVELVARVAAKVITREADTRHDHIQHLLRQAVRRLSDRSRLVVHLSPGDLEKVTQARAEGLLAFNGVKQIEFVADDNMVPGGVRIQSGTQTLDATLDSQLAEIVRGLLEEAYHEA